MLFLCFFLSFFSNQLHCSSKGAKAPVLKNEQKSSENSFYEKIVYFFLVISFFCLQIITMGLILFILGFGDGAIFLCIIYCVVLIYGFFRKKNCSKILIHQNYKKRIVKTFNEIFFVIFLFIGIIVVLSLPLIIYDNYKIYFSGTKEKVFNFLYVFFYIPVIFYYFFKYTKFLAPSSKLSKFSINFQKSFNDFQNVITISDENGVCAQAKDVEKIVVKIWVANKYGTVTIYIPDNNKWILFAVLDWKKDFEIEVFKNNNLLQIVSLNKIPQSWLRSYKEEKVIDFVNEKNENNNEKKEEKNFVVKKNLF